MKGNFITRKQAIAEGLTVSDGWLTRDEAHTERPAFKRSWYLFTDLEEESLELLEELIAVDDGEADVGMRGMRLCNRMPRIRALVRKFKEA